MTPIEIVIGRKFPKRPAYRHYILCRFITSNIEKFPDGFCGKYDPQEKWEGHAWKKIRQDRLVQASSLKLSFMGGKPMTCWFLTEKGKIEALKSEDVIRCYDADIKVCADLAREHYKQRKNNVS